MCAPTDEVQLTPKGAVFAYEWETLNYGILKLTKAIKFLWFDWQLDFIPCQGDQDEDYTK